MNTNTIIRILVFSLVFVVPVVIRLVKAASEAKEKRRLENLRQYQINEAMRTGRPIEPVMAAPMSGSAPGNPQQQTPQDRLREMAARRQAQIEALRRQRVQAPQNAPVQARPPTSYQQTSGESASTAFQQKPRVATGYQQQAPVATGYQQQPPRATGYQSVGSPRATPRQAPSRQARRMPQARPPERQASPSFHSTPEFPQPTGEIGGTPHDHDGSVTHRLVPDSPEPGPISRSGQQGTKAGGSAPGSRVDLSDLKRAVVLREILGAPMALRPPGDNR